MEIPRSRAQSDTGAAASRCAVEPKLDLQRGTYDQPITQSLFLTPAAAGDDKHTLYRKEELRVYAYLNERQVHPVDVGLYLKDSFTFTTNCNDEGISGAVANVIKKRDNNKNDNTTEEENLAASDDQENNQTLNLSKGQTFLSEEHGATTSGELLQLKECDSPIPDVKITSIALPTTHHSYND